MILICDPPRDAFLIHFQKRETLDTGNRIERDFHGSKIELCVDLRTKPHSLSTIHFLRGGFCLPFVKGEGLGIEHFHFCWNPEKSSEWKAYPGLTILFSHQMESGPSISGERLRPILQALVVDTKVLRVVCFIVS